LRDYYFYYYYEKQSPVYFIANLEFLFTFVNRNLEHNPSYFSTITYDSFTFPFRFNLFIPLVIYSQLIDF